MVLRWAASGLLATEKNFRRLMGDTDLWILAAALDRRVDQEDLAAYNGRATSQLSNMAGTCSLPNGGVCEREVFCSCLH